MFKLLDKTKTAAAGLAAGALVAVEGVASAQTDPIITIDWNQAIEDLGDSLQNPVTAAIGIGTAVFGIGLVWRMIKRFARG